MLNRRGTKCKVRCSGIDAPLAGTVEACANRTVSYTVKGKRDSCEEQGLDDFMEVMTEDDADDFDDDESEEE